MSDKSTKPVELTPEQAARVEDLRRLQEEIDKATCYVDEIKEELRALGPGRFAVDGKPVLDLTGGAAFDAETAKEVLSPGVYQTILVPKPDAGVAKEKLPGALYRKCQKSKSLSVKLL